MNEIINNHFPFKVNEQSNQLVSGPRRTELINLYVNEIINNHFPFKVNDQSNQLVPGPKRTELINLYVNKNSIVGEYLKREVVKSFQFC